MHVHVRVVAAAVAAAVIAGERDGRAGSGG